MKRIIKSAVIALCVLGGAMSVSAQSHLEDPRYGNTPEERTENLKKLNFLRDEYNNKNWNDAAVYLKDLMNDAPKSSANIYIYGATIYKNKINRSKSLSEKQIYLDSLMLIYDRRAEHYGHDPKRGRDYILRNKAIDYASINPMDREKVRQLYREAVDVSGSNLAGDLGVMYFNELVTDFKGNELEADVLLSEFERIQPLMVSNASPEELQQFESLFASSGAASCENLEALYSKALAANPGDLTTLEKAYNLMSMTGCEGDFYVRVAEQYYAKQPSSAVAIRLASVFENKGEFSSALKYLNESLASETNPAEKSNLYVRISASELGLKHPQAAAQAARQAIQLNPDNGYAFLFLAEAYISGISSNCSGFHASTVYWLAYDTFAKAKQAFSGDSAQLSHIESRMANCRANFPTIEEGFMYVQDYKDGASYTVSCGWISGVTTIRSR